MRVIYVFSSLLPLLALIVFLGIPAAASAAVLVEEDYDSLPVGTVLGAPEWEPILPGNDPTLPSVQNTDFKSSPHGAVISNDFGVTRLVTTPVDGTVTIELWMKPGGGNNTTGIAYDPGSGTVSGLGSLIRKDSSGNWLYFDGAVGSLVFFQPHDGLGHNVKIVLETASGLYDLYFDGNLIKAGAEWGPGGSFVGFQINSGQGGSGTSAFFDDLKITHEPSTTSVAIDVKPHKFPNNLNLSSDKPLLTAILGSASLDVRDIRKKSLTLGTAPIITFGPNNKALCWVWDVTGDYSGSPVGVSDGFEDLVCLFDTSAVVPDPGDTSVTLTGTFKAASGGGAIDGSDSVVIVP